MSNLAVIKGDIQQALVAAGVESVLPQTITIERFSQVAAMAIMYNPDLIGADRASVITALSRCANDGLVPDNKEAAIVTMRCNVAPKGQQKEWVTKAQYLPMIGGVLKRARMSGQVLSIAAKAVYADDTFRYWIDENGEHLMYEPAYRGGEVVLAFANARLTSGELIVEVMSRADIDKVRNASKTGQYGPWKDWFDRMACKAVAHRLARRLPNASELIEMCESGMNMAFDPRTEKDVYQPPEFDPIKRLGELLKGKPPEKYLPWLGVEKLEDLSEENAAAAVKKLENAKQ